MEEAFTDAKLTANPSPYSIQVLEALDKYFGKPALENSTGNSILDMKLQFFARSSKDYETIILPKDE